MATENEVLDALRSIIDPDLGKDIVSLGFIKNLSIDGATVRFDIELTTPACPVKDRFRAQAEEAVGALPGVDSVQVNLTAQKRKPKPGPSVTALEQVGSVVAVSSCKGGVGKSTVAAFLARALQREGLRAGLIDLDIHGPSLPTLFRMYNAEVYAQGDTLLPLEVDGLKTMSMGYLIGDRPAVMRGPMISNYAMQILQQTMWGALDYLILDLPPGTGDIQLTLCQQANLDGTIIVTTPQALSLVDVGRGILMFERVNVPVLGVVDNMAYFDCDGCGKRHHPFGSSTATLEGRYGVRTLAQLPILPALTDVSKKDSGADIPAFAELAGQLHREIGKRRAAPEAHPEVNAEEGFVAIKWPDGNVDRIPNKTLRLSCECAICVDEFTGDRLLDAEKVPDDIQAEEIQPLGNYAVGITWTDGHSSGIFSWEHLRRVAREMAQES